MKTDNEQQAKAWCFDNGVSESEIIAAWNDALSQGAFLIRNLNAHGHNWTQLPPHLLSQLIERYGAARNGGEQE